MKNLVRLLVASSVVAGLNSSAFAGAYVHVYDMGAHHDVVDYKTVSSACSHTLNGPGTLGINTYDEADPTDGSLRLSTSTAEFVWAPGYVGEPPASYYYSQNFSCSVDLTTTRNNPLAGGYSGAEVYPGSTYTVSASTSDPNNDQAPLHLVDTTGYHVESGTLSGQTGPFTLSALIGGKSYIHGSAVTGGTISMSSAMTSATTSIDIH